MYEAISTAPSFPLAGGKSNNAAVCGHGEAPWMERQDMLNVFPASGLPVGFLAIFNAGDLNEIEISVIEEDSVVAAAKPEAGAGRLEFFTPPTRFET